MNGMMVLHIKQRHRVCFFFFSCVSVILCASADTGQHLSLHVHDFRI